MTIFNKITKKQTPCAVALGTFDGVHIGHKSVINKALKYKKLGYVSSVVTFTQNPSVTLKKDFIGNLTSTTQKQMLIEQCGIDELNMIDFDDIKNYSAEDFIKEVLIDKLNVKVIICGFNFRFGKNREGNVELLKNIAKEQNIKVEIVPPVYEDGDIVSSTRIRACLKNGDIILANKLLGRMYFIENTVISGNKLGRKLGFPTMNQKIEDDLILPKFGVYSSFVVYDDKLCFAVTNIGIKPTIGEYSPLAETWVPQLVLDDMYNKSIKVYLIDFIRPEQKFNNIEELRNQVLLDGKKSEEIFNRMMINPFSV